MGRHTFDEPVTPAPRRRGRRLLVPMALTGTSLVLTVAVVAFGQGLTGDAAAPTATGHTALVPASYAAATSTSSAHHTRGSRHTRFSWPPRHRTRHRPVPIHTTSPSTPPTTTTPPASTTTSSAPTTTSSAPTTTSSAPTTTTSTTTATTPPASTTTTSTTAPPSTTTGTTTSAPSSNSFAQQVVELTNAQRAANGCGALTVNTTLTSVAQAHSADMAANNYFDHTDKQGNDPFARMRAAGYSFSYAGENIAAGQQTPAAVMDAWMNSPGHRANILNCHFTEIGVGYATGGSYGKYWTQDFGTPL